MWRRCFGIVWLLLYIFPTHAQQPNDPEQLLTLARLEMDSVHLNHAHPLAWRVYQIARHHEHVEQEILALRLLGQSDEHDSAVYYLQQAVDLAHAAGLTHLEVDARTELAQALPSVSGPDERRIIQELQMLFDNRRLAEDIQYIAGIGKILQRIGRVYIDSGSPRKAIYHLRNAFPFSPPEQHFEIYRNLAICYKLLGEYDSSAVNYERSIKSPNIPMRTRVQLASGIGDLYLLQGRNDEALANFCQSYQLAVASNNWHFEAWTQEYMSKILEQRGDYDSALTLLRRGMVIMTKRRDFIAVSMMQLRSATIYLTRHQRDSARMMLEDAMVTARLADDYGRIQFATTALVQYFEEEGDYQTAWRYQRDHNLSVDSVLQTNLNESRLDIETSFKFQEIDLLKTQSIINQEEIEQKKRLVWMTALFVGASLLIAIMIYQAVRRRSAANRELTLQNDIMAAQKEELATSLSAVADAKAKMIYTEKMASLGQLTAGVAHEINNPLNFISGGMEALHAVIDDLLQEVQASRNIDTAAVQEIRDDLFRTRQSILNGVDRCHKIISGLNTFTSPQKQERHPLKIEPLIDMAILLLSRRIKDTQAEVKLHYVNTEVYINGNPSQLNQVFLNLINNALQAMEKQEGPRQLTIETSVEQHFIISIRDNGPGIPKAIQRRILEPFFTTKPVGQGTGLGLSIAMDIIEAHEGTLTFQSEADQGTTFTITLPILHH